MHDGKAPHIAALKRRIKFSYMCSQNYSSILVGNVY